MRTAANVGSVSGGESSGACDAHEGLVERSALLPIDAFFASGSPLVLDNEFCLVIRCPWVVEMQGLPRGDLITHVDEELVHNSNDFRDAICSKEAICRLRSGLRCEAHLLRFFTVVLNVQRLDPRALSRAYPAHPSTGIEI